MLSYGSNIGSILYCTVCIVLMATCATDISNELCPNPDNSTDAAEGLNTNLDRPPSGIKAINITHVGPYSIGINWPSPMFHYQYPIPICHYYLNVTYTPQQKGSHMRTTHMNVNQSINAATLNELTADTNISIELRACLLMPENAEHAEERQFICTLPVKLTQKTSSSPDTCAAGQYNNTENVCAPCQCNNRTLLCESKTGKCLDCLDGSDGASCEKCLAGYKMSEDNQCVQPSLTPAESTVPIIIKATTQPDITPTKSSPGGVNPILPRHSTMTIGGLNISKTTSKPGPNYLVTQKNAIPIAIMVTCVFIGIAVISCIALSRKRGWCRKKPLPFWTLQLQDGRDNQPSVAYSDIIEPGLSSTEDNNLIENDFTAHQFGMNDNPYRPITA